MIRQSNRFLAALALMGALSIQLVTLAEQTGSQITAVEVDNAGNLVLSVEGEGFDPLVHIESAPNGQFRIIVQSREAMFAPGLFQARQTIAQDLKAKIPALAGTDLSQSAQSEGGVQVVLTAWQKLQPQVRSNTGQKIVIALVGNHALPPAILARQKQEALLRQQAELKRQQALAESKRKAEALQKKQAEQQARQEALRKQKLAAEAEAEKRLALQKQQQAVEQAVKTAQQTMAAQPKLVVQAPGSAKRVNLSSLQQQNKTGSPGIPVSSANLDLSDLSRPVTPTATETPYDLRSLQLAQHLQKPFNPGMLAQDKIPAADTILPQDGLDDPTVAPTEPLRLKTPPPGFMQTIDNANDQGNFDGNAVSTDYQRVFSNVNTQSLYSLINQPNAHPVIRKAWQDVTSGNTTAAELGLRALLEKSPNELMARYLLARILLQPVIESIPLKSAPASAQAQSTQARKEAARQELLKIVLQAPYLPAYLDLLDLYIEDENYQDASRLWAKVSSKYPDNAMVLYRRGRLNEGLNDLNTARYAYLQVLAKQPDHVESHYRLAQVELNADQLEAARWELTQALSLVPEDDRLWKLMGYIAEKQNNKQASGQFYRQVIQADALLNYARTLDSQNRHEQAFTLYQAVESLADDNLDLLYNLGMIYTELRKADRAEAVLKRFLKLNPDETDSRNTQAKTMLKQLGRKIGGKSNEQPKILPF